MARKNTSKSEGEVWPLKPGSWEVDGEKSHTSVPYPLSTAGTGPGSRNHVRRRGLLDMARLNLRFLMFRLESGAGRVGPQLWPGLSKPASRKLLFGSRAAESFLEALAARRARLRLSGVRCQVFGPRVCSGKQKKDVSQDLSKTTAEEQGQTLLHAACQSRRRRRTAAPQYANLSWCCKSATATKACSKSAEALLF